jgi:hypothetical protein
MALRAGNADIVTYYNARINLNGKELAVVQLRQALAEFSVALETVSGRIFTVREMAVDH